MPRYPHATTTATRADEARRDARRLAFGLTAYAVVVFFVWRLVVDPVGTMTAIAAGAHGMMIATAMGRR